MASHGRGSSKPLRVSEAERSPERGRPAQISRASTQPSSGSHSRASRSERGLQPLSTTNNPWTRQQDPDPQAADPSPSRSVGEGPTMSYGGPYSSAPGYPPSYGPTAPYQGPPGTGNIWTSSPMLYSAPGTYGSGPPSQPGMSTYGGPPPAEYGIRRASSPEGYFPVEEDPAAPWLEDDPGLGRSSSARDLASQGAHRHRQRRPGNRDEFDGPVQFLPRPSPRAVAAATELELPHLATNLGAAEQDAVLGRVNACLAECAFRFVARWQFPIPLEPDKRRVRGPGDREWTEWAHLLKRLATKRRVPARVLYNGQIKQLVTVLDNSLEVRHAAAHQSRPLKDDRNVLQLVSAGLQVAKLLKDAGAMRELDELYVETEDLIRDRKAQPAFLK